MSLPAVAPFGYPRPGGDSYKIAFFGDPWLGAGLARRHTVIWLRPEDAQHVLQNEEPDLLMVSPRADSVRALRTKPLVGKEGDVSSECEGLISAFRSAGVPTVFYGLVDRLELARYLPVAKMVDCVAAMGAAAAEKYLRAGCRTVVDKAIGSFGFTQGHLRRPESGQLRFIVPFDLKTGGKSRGNAYSEQRSILKLPAVDYSTDPIHSNRVGMSQIRHTAWNGRVEYSDFAGISGLVLSARSWLAPPTCFFDAAINGVVPLAFGSPTELDRLGLDARLIASYDSMDECAAQSGALSSSWTSERQMAVVSWITQGKLSDDWIATILEAIGAPPRSSIDPPVALAFPSGLPPLHELARLLEISQPSALLMPSTAGTDIRDLDFNRPILIGPEQSEAWKGLVLEVRNPAVYDAQFHSMIGGWRRLSRSSSVSVFSPRSSQEVAVLKDGGSLWRATDGAGKPSLRAIADQALNLAQAEDL